MTQLSRRSLLANAIIAGGLAALPRSGRAAQKRVPLNAGLTGYLDECHDPVMIREGDTYHVFGSGGWNHIKSPSWRTSRDLKHWVNAGTVFETMPEWVTEAIPVSTVFWAPDIAFVDGVFRMYYAVSTGGSMRSVIGFATSATLDRRSTRYGWTDHGLVTETFPGGNYNAIDANFIVDHDGNHWLSFGSYWGGLKLIQLDRRTGKPLDPKAEPIAIAYLPAPNDYGNNPIEAPFIFERDGWFYLFASYQYCCRGAASNYSVSTGRSRDVRGPYLDNHGRKMMEGYGKEVLADWPFGSSETRGPGHCGLLRDGNRDLIVYHVEDPIGKSPLMRIAEIEWTADGWPVAIL